MPRATIGRTLSHVAIAAVVGVALIVLAKIAARFHYDPALWALAGWQVPADAGVFIRAGDDVLAGRSPYFDVDTIPDDIDVEFGYVYPPLLALAASPLSLVSATTASMLWSVLLMGCVVGALWLLDVRDWRCYLVALLWPFNRVALDWGKVDPILVLFLAAGWRYRDTAWATATATGAAVATKLFLWPAGFWLFVTGRRRAAGLSVVATLGLVLLPWAVIGFADLLQYPALLRRVSGQEYESFSMTALVYALTDEPAITRVIVLAIGASLLAFSVRCARHPEWTPRERDRRSLTVILAAALVLSPVVWSDYYLLLVVPVALAYPRLSALWLFVLAASLFRTFHRVDPDPDGDLLQLTVVSVFVTAVFVAAYRPDCSRLLRSNSARTRDVSDSMASGA